VILLLLLLAQQPVQAPVTTPDSTKRPCIVDVDFVGRQGRQKGNDMYAGGGVRAHCRGTGTTLVSDSLAWYADVNRLDLVGNVKIRDTAIALDGNLVNYYRLDERLEAHNHVVAVNHDNGSVLRGPNLTYYRAVPGVRDTVEMYATQRPTIEFRGAGVSDTTEPYVIVGDRVRLRGNDRMWAAGKATIDRSDFAARGDSMALDQTRGLGVLIGKPLVEGKGDQHYTLTGTRIELGLDRRDIRIVKALGDGKATGSDWTLVADTIHLALERRKLQQAFAWGTKVRPYAKSPQQTILADSLALDVPDQVLTEARAFGQALSTTKRDSMSSAADVDWISGDTLVAHWTQEGDPGGGAPKQHLRSIVSRGSARALTHIYNDKDPTAQPSLNYTRGGFINIALRQSKIDRIVAGPRADGVHLEPQPPPTDSTHADSTAKKDSTALPDTLKARRDST
jgi:hypothetical protein